MITIIPNWHPLLVHFTIGLLSMAIVFYFASALLADNHRWKQQWLNTANWTLWSGCIFTILTALAGWHAYNTVTHDDAGHVAMTLHRNWALATASVFLVLGVSALILASKNSKPGALFLAVAAVALVSLMTTGFLGGEVVYRHGLGVMALPEPETEMSEHQHNDHAAAHHHDDEDADEHHSEISPDADIEMNMDMDQHSHDSELEPDHSH